jgi:hypothetical protein
MIEEKDIPTWKDEGPKTLLPCFGEKVNKALEELKYFDFTGFKADAIYQSPTFLQDFKELSKEDQFFLDAILAAEDSFMKLKIFTEDKMEMMVRDITANDRRFNIAYVCPKEDVYFLLAFYEGDIKIDHAYN